jgi:uncharacterized protein (TIGR02217 family)
MAFKNLEFPRDLSPGLEWGAGYEVETVEENNGAAAEIRNQISSYPRHSANAAKVCKNEAMMRKFMSFFHVMAAQTFSFKVRNWQDYKVIRAEGRFRDLGDGTWQFVKRWTEGAYTSDDYDVTLPEQGTLAVYTGAGALMVESSDYTINYSTGVLTTLESPDTAPVQWSGQYFIRARFDMKRLGVVIPKLAIFKTLNLPIIEVGYEEDAS